MTFKRSSILTLSVVGAEVGAEVVVVELIVLDSSDDALRYSAKISATLTSGPVWSVFVIVYDSVSVCSPSSMIGCIVAR